MNKIKVSILCVISLLVVNFVKAQSIDDGKKFLFYERYKSAKDVFEKWRFMDKQKY